MHRSTRGLAYRRPTHAARAYYRPSSHGRVTPPAVALLGVSIVALVSIVVVTCLSVGDAAARSGRAHAPQPRRTRCVEVRHRVLVVRPGPGGEVVLCRTHTPSRLSAAPAARAVRGWAARREDGGFVVTRGHGIAVAAASVAGDVLTPPGGTGVDLAGGVTRIHVREPAGTTLTFTASGRPRGTQVVRPTAGTPAVVRSDASTSSSGDVAVPTALSVAAHVVVPDRYGLLLGVAHDTAEASLQVTGSMCVSTTRSCTSDDDGYVSTSTTSTGVGEDAYEEHDLLLGPARGPGHDLVATQSGRASALAVHETELFFALPELEQRITISGPHQG